jgi:hypothetical protein
MYGRLWVEPSKIKWIYFKGLNFGNLGRKGLIIMKFRGDFC